MRLSRAYLLALTAALAACPAPSPEGSCESTADCLDDEICVAGTCRRVCNSGADCTPGKTCRNGVCLPPTAAAGDAGSDDAASSLDAAAGDRAAADSSVRDSALPDRGCPQGEHDGGDGTCVPVGTCLLGFHDGGDGSCVPAGSCVGGFHDGGDGSCVPLDQCVADYHDGGSGVCVPTGTCFPGFAMGYPDGDGDGVGVEPLTGDCYQALPAGLAPVAGDCDDGDASVFVEVAAATDLDGDGYTGPPEQVCAGDQLPPGYQAALTPPPQISLEAAAAASGGGPGNSWGYAERALYPDSSGARCDLGGHDSSEALLITDLDLRVPAEAEIRGVRVHVRRRAVCHDFSGDVRDTVAQLLVGGELAGSDLALIGDTWPSDYTEVVYGGADALWGLALTPAAINDAGFGFALQVAYDGMLWGADAYVDHVWVEVFADQGGDCDDGDPAVWSWRAGFDDGDGDRYTAAPERLFCIGTGLAGLGVQRSLGEDCYDANADAHPGATGYHADDRGDGSFDYNCNGQLERAPITVDTACGCPLDVCEASATASHTPSGSCGSSTSYAACTGTCANCRLGTSSTTVRCR